MARFAGKTALVTGAASGIGAACVGRLAEEGIARLILIDRDGERLSQVSPCCPVERHVGDVADEALWKAVARDAPTPDLAVIAAGISHAAAIAEETLDDWRRVLATNLDGAFLALRFAMRVMATGGSGGAIVTIASAAGIKAEPSVGAYGASKAALLQLTRVAAKEGAPDRIRVNAIAPGGVDTPIWDGVPVVETLKKRYGSRSAALAEIGKAGTPLGRFAQASEIAAQIAFLLSDEAATMTGSVLTSDGGYTL